MEAIFTKLQSLSISSGTKKVSNSQSKSLNSLCIENFSVLQKVGLESSNPKVSFFLSMGSYLGEDFDNGTT